MALPDLVCVVGLLEMAQSWPDAAWFTGPMFAVGHGMRKLLLDIAISVTGATDAEAAGRA